MSPLPKLKTSEVPRVLPGLEFKLASAKAGVIEGYGSTFGGQPDLYGDVVAAGAFKRTLAEHKASGTMPSMLWLHRADEPIGRWTEMREDERGLYVRGELNTDTARGREVASHIAHGDVDGLSIGFFVAEDGRKRGSDGVSILTDLDLFEVSIVTIPANRHARLSGSKQLGSKTELVSLLRNGGLSKAAAQRIAAGGWPALASEDHTKATELAERIARATAELRRA